MSETPPPRSSSAPRESELLLAPAGERLCMDEMLKKYCGEFGWWQLRHFVLTSMAWALEALHIMVVIFADRQPAWRCIDGAATGCSSDSKSVCGLQAGSWEWIGGEGSSTVAEFGLICSEKYKVGLVQALFFAGCMIGAGIFGHLSDSKLGRKGSLVVVCILNAIFGCLTAFSAFSPTYWIYAAFRFLTGCSTGGGGPCAFVLATEPVGPTKRGGPGSSTFYFYSGGIALLCGISYVFQSWRALYIATSMPSVLFLIFVLPFVSESPRWCLVRGEMGAAMKTMRSIAISNGRILPDGVILALDHDSSNREAITGSLVDVFRSPLTRFRLLLAVAINFLCAIVFYGLSLNVVNLGTNLHLNVLLNAVAEMPAYLLTGILLNRLGRKPLTIGTQWFSGAFCIVGGLMTTTYGYGAWKTIRMLCGILGIFGMGGGL